MFRLWIVLPALVAATWFCVILFLFGDGVPASSSKISLSRPASDRLAPATTQSPPLACQNVRVVVLCSPVDTDQHLSRVEAIQKTWGAGGVFYGHNGTSGSCIRLGVTFSNTPQPAIEDTSEWLKAFLSELQEHPELSWLVKVEDTSGLLPERLAAFLAFYDPAQQLLLGNQLQTTWGPHHRYVSGAGFAVSGAALKRVRDSGGLALVPAKLQKVPDVGFSSICISLGTRLPDTRDNQGGERFNVFPPHVCARGAFHDWYRDYKKEAGQPPLGGSSCCAADSVLFQYIGPQEQMSLPMLLPGSSTHHQQVLQPGWQWPRPTLFDRWDRLLSDDHGAELQLLSKLRAASQI